MERWYETPGEPVIHPRPLRPCGPPTRRDQDGPHAPRSDARRLRGDGRLLQAGAQTFSQAYFFTTPEALRTFEETKGFEVGAGLDWAVADFGSSGAISSATLQKPLIVFVWGQQGLMAGVKVEGQKITRLEAD